MPTSITFDIKDQPQTLSLPEPGRADVASVFVMSLPKAGSTLLNRIMRPLCVQAGLNPFSLENELRGLGVRGGDYPQNVEQLFVPQGYAYVGFRGFSGHHELPAFANGRTVFLVRDPRDMMTSLYFSHAFSHQPPGSKADNKLATDFATERNAALQSDVSDYVLRFANTLNDNYLRMKKVLSAVDHKVWRYEDVVFDKQRWTEDMVAYLGLDVKPAAIARVVAKNDVRPDAEAVTEHVRKVTPGDHREKLSPETIAKLNTIFAQMLSDHGYA